MGTKTLFKNLKKILQERWSLLHLQHLQTPSWFSCYMANIRYPVEKSWKIIPISAAKDWLALQGPHPSSHDKSWIPSPKGNTWHMIPMISHVFSAQPHKSDSPSPHFCTRCTPKALKTPSVHWKTRRSQARPISKDDPGSARRSSQTSPSGLAVAEVQGLTPSPESD